jgi:flagellar assembly factor FliW
MNLNTKNFGEIEIDESKVIYFELGLPGFENYKKFILINEQSNQNEQEKQLSFWWLQSIDDSNISFAVIDAFLIFPDYNPLINIDLIQDLGEYTQEDLLTYNIVVIPEDIEKISVNLKAPIVINRVTKKAKQVIVNNEEYTLRHYIIDELKDME